MNASRMSRLQILSAMTFFAMAQSGCAPGNAALQTVAFPHTPARNQTIGNCWAYATLGWVESLVLQNGGEAVDYSEAYLTYRHFEAQLLDMTPQTPVQARRLDPSGTFASARALISSTGLMRELDFPSSNAEGSAEESALATLQKSLAEGSLRALFTGITPADRASLVRAELDKAFGVTLADLEPRALRAENLAVNTPQGTTPLSTELGAWTYVDFPLNMDDLPRAGTPFPYQSQSTGEQNLLLRQLKKALNEHRPVPVAWLVDDAALDNRGVFSAETWRNHGAAGAQGFHITIAVDYTASGIDPQTGQTFQTAEGEVSPEQKMLAERFGKIESLIVKNSWGERREQTYALNGKLGYSRLDASYLFSWLPREGASELVIRSLILPR